MEAKPGEALNAVNIEDFAVDRNDPNRSSRSANAPAPI
jgi:hypothetical protein